MEDLKKNGMVGFRALLMAVVVVIMLVEGAAGELHKVGARGWIPNYNYSQWLIQQHQHFYVGDWLYFIYDKHYFNVLEVNETSYESCTDKGFIQNITRGGRDVVELKEARPYYFLSSGGYCWNGMKIAISVELPPTPAPAPAKNASPSSSSTAIHFILLYIAFHIPFVFTSH